MNPKVDAFLGNLEKWQDELKRLRMIILDCGLTEEVKWNVPIYTFNDKNVVGINGLKEYCALAFFKGALLSDSNSILVTPGEHTQGVRWVKFTSAAQVDKMAGILKTYIYEAIEVEKAGLKIASKKPEEYAFPEELQHKLNESPTLKTAFEALTPGRQKGYLLYFAQPKQSKTREARIEKYIPHILAGKGLND